MGLVWLVLLLEGSVVAVARVTSIGVVVRSLVALSSVVSGKLPIVVPEVVSVGTGAVFTVASSVVFVAVGGVVAVVWVGVGSVAMDAVAVNTVVTISVSITVTRGAVVLRVLVVLSIGLVIVMVVLGLEVALLALSVGLLVVAVVVDVLADGLVVLGGNHGAVVLVEVDFRVTVDWLVMAAVSAGGVVRGHVSTDTMAAKVGTVGVTWVHGGVAVSVAGWVCIGTVGTVGWVAISIAVTIGVVRGSVGESSGASVVVGWDGNSGVIFSVVLVTMMVAVVAIVVGRVVVLGVRPVLDVLGRGVTHVVSVDFLVVVVELVVGLGLSLSVRDGSNNGESKRSHLYFFKRFFIIIKIN